MDHVLCGQIVSPGRLRLSRRAAAERSAFLEQARSGRTVDRAVDPAAAEQ
jgi:hypothetical protein